MKPVRVLHILGAMNRGGAETWLMHVLRHIDRERFQLDFLVHTEQPAAYDAEIRSLGSRIFHCPHYRDPARYAWQFSRIVRRFGPFDALHSHVHHFSGFPLALGRLHGVPVRIAHSHSDTGRDDARAGRTRRLYLAAGRRLIRAHCTLGLAAAEPAASALFGPAWRGDGRFQIFYCAIDLAPFREAIARDAVRAEFGLSPQDLVFGHVGRFSPMKNHTFLIDVAAHVVLREPRARFLLVGDGPLRPAAERRVREAGLESKVIFAGLRPDVPRLVRGAMDVGLLPSLHEGLPVSMIEIQAAGVRSVLSANVTREAVINPEIVACLPLAAGPEEWARVALDLARQARYDPRRALRVVEAGPFSITQRLGYLAAMYAGHPAARPAGRPILQPDLTK